MIKDYKNLSLPDAVLFDTDNTLYEYQPCHEAGLSAVLNKSSNLFNIDNNSFKKSLEKVKKSIKSRLGPTASSHSRLLYFQGVLEDLGLGSQVLTALDLEQTYWREFLNSALLFDGVIDLLDDLKYLNIPTAVVTDLTAQIQFRKIFYFKLHNHFNYIVSSEEAGFDKPNPKPFLLALKKIKPKGKNIWMIGDNLEADIVGSRKSINAITFQKKHKGIVLKKGNIKSDYTFTNYKEIRSLIKNLV